VADPVDPWESVSDRDTIVPEHSWAPAALAERARLWLRFVGPARLATGVVVAIALAGAAFWLLRTPSPPTEARLPYARASVTTAAGVSTSTIAATVAPTTTAALVVYVTGAVMAPGVYRVPAGGRVGDAITAAGGPGPGAAADALNLAAPLRDGDRVDVPAAGELASPAFTTLAPGVVHAAVGSDPSPGPVDLNRATAAELEALPGIGPATAAAILTYRAEHGAFSAVDELEDVPGIGPAKLAALRGLVAA
jgi:competence protein ComEA